MKPSVGFSIVAIASFAFGVASAHGQALLSFTGGSGTKLSFTLSQSVTYTVTTAKAAGVAPFFDFQGVGNVFPSEPSVTGTITFSINLGAKQSLGGLASGYTGGAVAITDVWAYGAFPALAVGDLVTLNAGTVTTNSTYAAATPTGGSFPTFLVSSNGTVVSANGIAAAPEPSTWAMMLGGIGILGVMLLRARRGVPVGGV